MLRQLKLYYSPGACSLAPHIVLEELGDPYAIELVSIPEGKTSSPEFLRINPKGRVPVLSIDGAVLTEAPAILIYLAQSRPDAGLLPASILEFARCIEWFNWISGTVHAMSIAQVWRPHRFIDDMTVHPDISAKGKRNLTDAYNSIEAKLSGKVWAVGERYSIVDPYLLVFYRWGNRIGIPMKDRYPNWTQHTDRLLIRPAVSKIVEREGIRKQIYEYLEHGFNPHPKG
jgi:glutathione S-transferase